MPLKMKRSYPYTERQAHIQQPCDVTFEHKANKLHLVLVEVALASHECLAITARSLVVAAKMFDKSDSHLSDLIDSLSNAVRSKVFTRNALAYVQSFANQYRDKIDWQNEKSPETGIVSASLSMADAIDDHLNQRYEDCHTNTVRARASLAKSGLVD